MGKKALLIVDVLEDFVYGSMAIPGAADMVPFIEEEMVKDEYDFTVAIFEMHPENHCSFVENGGPWPKHCVGEGGMPVYDVPNDEVAETKLLMWIKGRNPLVDSYSAFYDNERNPLGLTQYLKSLDVDEVFVCGLALDYCVKFTALDAKADGFKVTLLQNLTKAVDNKQDNINAVILELMENGVSIDVAKS